MRYAFRLTRGVSGNTGHAILVPGPRAGREILALEHDPVAGVPILVHGRDSSNSGSACNHGQVCGQTDQMLEMDDLGARSFDLVAKSLCDRGGEEVIPESTATGVVDNAGDLELIHNFPDDIAIAPFRVAMAGENPYFMATFVQASGQPLGMGFDTAEGARRIAIADLQDTHGSGVPRASGDLEALPNSGMQAGQRILSDESLHIFVVMRIHLADFLVVKLTLSVGRVAKGNTAGVEDEEIVAEANFPASGLGSLAEIVFFAVAGTEIGFVEKAHVLKRAQSDVHAETDRRDEFRAFVFAGLAHQAIEGLGGKSGGKRVFFHESRDAADRAIVGKRRGDAGT